MVGSARVSEPQTQISGFDFCNHLIIPIMWNPEYPPEVQGFAL